MIASSSAERNRERSDAANGFGPIDPGLITRAASLVAVLSALGLQSLTGGFLWGLMSQKSPTLAAAEVKTVEAAQQA